MQLEKTNGVLNNLELILHRELPFIFARAAVFLQLCVSTGSASRKEVKQGAGPKLQ